MVAQTRSACANEVRKRDRQIDGLKKAVTDAGRARGQGRSAGITTINVVGDIGGDNCTKMAARGTPTSLPESTYDLRMVTNTFLAELAKGLSEQNEGLLDLVQHTTDSLKEMCQWEHQVTARGGDGLVQVMAVDPREMAGELEAILEHLRTMITNPSFVPIEEVHVRDREIIRLRDGWEKMETRWSEAVHLMDGWKKRMQADGRPVNVEELKMGLRLSPVRVRNVTETTHSLGLRLAAVEETEQELSRLQSPTPENSLHLVPAPEYDADDVSDVESSIFEEDDLDVNDLDVEEPNVQVLQQSVMFDHSSPLPTPPQLSPLKDNYSAGNRGERDLGVPIKLKGLGEFTTIVEESTHELREEETRAPEPPPHLIKPHSPKKQASKPIRSAHQEDTPPSSVGSADAKPSPDNSIKLVKPEQLSVTTPDEAPATKAEGTASSKPASSAASARQRTTTTRPTRSERLEPTRQAPSRPTTRTTRTTRQREEQHPPQQPQPSLRPRPSRPELSRPEHSSRPNTTNNNSSPSQHPPPPPSAKPVRTASATSTTSTATNTSTTSQPPRSPVKSGNSRLPLPRNGTNILPPPVQSPLTMATINAKLVASEREADAARVRAKLRAAKLARSAKQQEMNVQPSDARDERGTQEEKEVERHKGQQPQQKHRVNEGEEEELDQIIVEKPRKRERRTSKAANRRRSTLNPRELQSLIQGVDVGAVDAS